MEAMIPKAVHDAALAEKQEQIDALRHELEQLKRLIFDFKSERHVPQKEGADAGAEDVGKAEEEEIVVPAHKRRKRKQAHPGRANLPEHLPRRRVVIEPDEDTTGMVKIGEDITSKVNFIPPVLEVVDYVRPRYARPEAEQTEGVAAVVQAPAPEQVLPKAIADTGLIVQIAVAKYIDHLPLYRQRQMILRDYDWDIPASTIGDWLKATSKVLEPLYQALLVQVLATDYLQGDESRLSVLEWGEQATKNKSHRHPKKLKRKVHLGYMWVFRNPIAGLVLFAYRPGRGAKVLNETLADHQGYLQSDGYSAYTAYLKRHEGVQLISCLAHIRRKFFDALSNHPQLAERALADIRYLYRVERIASQYALSAKRRQRLRQYFARPKYEALQAWVKEQHEESLPKSGIGKALTYAVNHLPRLAPYLEDGRIEIDNNQIENKIRPLALGRKNYLFAGSHEAAQRTAMMYSFFASCREHAVNPRVWLEDVLLRIRDTRPSRMQELLPGNWKQHYTGKKAG